MAFGGKRPNWKLNRNFLSHYLKPLLHDYVLCLHSRIKINMDYKKFALITKTKIQISHLMSAYMGAPAFSYIG